MPGGGGIGGRGSVVAKLKRSGHNEKSVKVGTEANTTQIKWTVTVNGTQLPSFTLPMRRTAVRFKWEEL
jgi:hypothetical protein